MKLRKFLKRYVEDRKIPEPVTNWDMCEEGIIILDDGGTTYRGQTGGCACNHPEATGQLYLCKVSKKLQRMFDSGVYTDPATANNYFIKKGLPLRLIDGEEAWIRVEINMGNENVRAAVIVYNNSD